VSWRQEIYRAMHCNSLRVYDGQGGGRTGLLQSPGFHLASAFVEALSCSIGACNLCKQRERHREDESSIFTSPFPSEEYFSRMK
jgi:hypothetical protein